MSRWQRVLQRLLRRWHQLLTQALPWGSGHTRALFLSSQYLHLEIPGCRPHLTPEQGWSSQSLESGPILILWWSNLRTPAVRMPKKWKTFVLVSWHCAVPGALISHWGIWEVIFSAPLSVCFLDGQACDLTVGHTSHVTTCRAVHTDHCRQANLLPSVSCLRTSLLWCQAGTYSLLPYQPSICHVILTPTFLFLLCPWYDQKSTDRELN